MRSGYARLGADKRASECPTATPAALGEGEPSEQHLPQAYSELETRRRSNPAEARYPDAPPS